MASDKTTLDVSPGSGASLLMETEASGQKTPVHYAYEGRLIPVKPSAFADSSFSVDNSGDTDILALKPSGAKFLRLQVNTADVSIWDNGWSPTTDGAGFVIVAGDIMDFPNLDELSSLLALATSATSADCIALWYKTSS